MSRQSSLPKEQEEEQQEETSPSTLCAIVFYNNKFVEIYNNDATLQDICEALGIDVYNTEAYIVDRVTGHAVATLPSDCLPLINRNTHKSRKEDGAVTAPQDNNNTFVDFWGEVSGEAQDEKDDTANASVEEHGESNKKDARESINNDVVLEFELVTPNLHDSSSKERSEESQNEEKNEVSSEKEEYENRRDNQGEEHEENEEQRDVHSHNRSLQETEETNLPFAMEDGSVNSKTWNTENTYALSEREEAMQTLFRLAHKWHAVELLTAELPHRLSTLPQYDPTASEADLLTSIVYHSGVYNPHRPQHDPLFSSAVSWTSVSDAKGTTPYVNSVEPYSVSSSVSSVLAQRPDVRPLTTEELKKIYEEYSNNTNNKRFM